MKKRKLMSSRTRKKGSSSSTVDINSLLDILMILLIFLIKSFGSNEIELTIPKEVSIPISISSDFVKKNMTIQIMEDGDILLGENFVTNISKDSTTSIITPLLKILLEKKAVFKKIKREMSDLGDKKLKPDSNINLVMDGSVKYALLRKVMNTSSQAGYKEFKFIVKHLGE